MHTADRKSSHLGHTGDFSTAATSESSWEASPPAQGYSAVAVCKEGSTAASPICSALGDVPTLGQCSQPLGGQIITAGSYLQTKSSVEKKKKQPENTTVALDYFLEFMTLSYPQLPSIFHRHVDKYTLTLSHSHSLLHTHPSLCCTLGETGLGDAVLWDRAIPSGGISADRAVALSSVV